MSEKLGISATQCRYWSKLLNIKISKKGRIAYIQADSGNLLDAMKKSVESGVSPSVAAVEVKSTFADLPMVEANAPQDNRINELEKAVMLLVESNKRLSTDNKMIINALNAQNSIIVKQSMEITKLTSHLLPKPEPVKLSQKTNKSVKKVSVFKKLWLELFNPEALRAMP